MKNILKFIFHITLTLVISSTLIFSSFAVPVKKAEARSGALATEFSNLRISFLQTIGNVSSAATAGATTGNFLKENMLDGIGWAIAKQMVSAMTRSLVNWINSGFQGSPAFITDLNGFLLDALDSVAGEYISGLGGIGEFICSPFKLDVRAALSINYAQARSGMPSGPTACTLTGIRDNIENFMQGTVDSMDQWISVTSNPQNTPYGAYLEAEAKLNARLVNEAGQQIQIANWGDGFLSKKICEAVNGGTSGTSNGHCTITTPGKVISEALTFQLSTGPRSLIEADEINEIISALINQLTLKAMQSISGLLGLSGGTGYTDYNYDDGSGASSTRAYIDAAFEQATASSTVIVRIDMDDALATEQSFLTLINSAISAANSKLIALGATTTATSSATSTITIGGLLTGTGSSSTSTPLTINLNDGLLPTTSASVTITDLYGLISEAQDYKVQVNSNISDIATIISAYDNADANATASRSADAIRLDVVLEYIDLKNYGNLTKITVVETKRVEWSQLLQ